MFTTSLFTNPQTKYTEAFNNTYGSFSDQLNQITALNNKYDDLSRNILTHDALKLELSSLDKYLDYSGNHLSYTDAGKTVKEAVKEDIHSMILQQNNSYILGMIAISTVLITTFLLTRK
jgi:hypothetical protein